MIPKFLGLSWVKKILATGKSINFLHAVCHNSVPIPGKESVKRSLQKETSPANLFSDPTDNKFHEVLERCYRETSSLVLDILFKQYKFIDHVTAMRKYLLLGQGDLIRYLLELLVSCCEINKLYFFG
jgi:gamma-tubulin complex component 3